ncbi:MAG TPA: histidine phosphatase family protein [Caulobacter sp.]|nr:histidine phosphatase family protein [Caulobacter sp.]
MSKHWPSRLWIVRHGESAGNVARDRADAAGLGRIDIGMRDVEVPLSSAGCDQARALGRWFASQPADRRPEAVLASPYLRARHTAELIAEAGGLAPDTPAHCIDERLREREFGILDRLTRAGILEHFPEEAERRTFLGKFYHRPPGGESWADVILRLRSMLDTLSLHHEGERVLIVCHQVVVLCLRYLLENLDETAILAIDAEKDVSNCGVTEYELDPDRRNAMRLVRYNFVAPLLEAGAPVTTAPDANVAAR